MGQYSLYVSMSRNVFCRVELNVFSSSRFEFLPSRMSFARVECLFVESNIFSSSRVSFHRVSNARSSSRSAYSLSCNNYSSRNITFRVIETVIYAWVQIFAAFHISLHGPYIFFYFPAISIGLISPSFFMAFRL